MRISVVIPSRGIIEVFENILKSLKNQTFKDFEVMLIFDKRFEKKSDFDDFENDIRSKFKSLNLNIFCHVNYENEWKWNNASFLRNIGIKKAKGEFINIFDDDIIFGDNYLEESVKYYDDLKNKEGKEILIAPTMIYRKTDVIQSQGFSDFNFFLCRPIAYNLGEKKYEKIRMFSGNSLFGKTEIFRDFLFDEAFDFVNEDLDFTYRISKKHSIFVLKDLIVNHMEKEKTLADTLWIGNEYQAYNRSKHRIMFVRKVGTFWEKLIAYSVGLLGNNLWLSWRILKYGKSPEKFNILRAYLKGILDGIRFKF